MRKLLIGFFSIIIFISCSNIKQVSQNNSVPKLKFINAIEIPFNQEFQNTKIGGLSGIDYDKKQDLYYIICDERSQENLSRFYTTKIHIKNDTLRAIDFKESKHISLKYSTSFSALAIPNTWTKIFIK